MKMLVVTRMEYKYILAPNGENDAANLAADAHSEALVVNVNVVQFEEERVEMDPVSVVDESGCAKEASGTSLRSGRKLLVKKITVPSLGNGFVRKGRKLPTGLILNGRSSTGGDRKQVSSAHSGSPNGSNLTRGSGSSKESCWKLPESGYW